LAADQAIPLNVVAEFRLFAPVAQLDRAPDYESGGQEFESLRVRHYLFDLNHFFAANLSAKFQPMFARYHCATNALRFRSR
jgi:hypothetical protein